MSATLDYPGLLREAGRDVVRRVLTQVAEEGLPGEHHFYLTFDTTKPGVEMAPGLRRRYPQAMTVILQHQFWELAVDDEAFSVTLRFGGRHERLRIPFAALTSFVDPAAELGLQFTAPEVPPTTSETAEVAGLTPGDGQRHPGGDAKRSRSRDQEPSGNVLRFERTHQFEEE